MSDISKSVDLSVLVACLVDKANWVAIQHLPSSYFGEHERLFDAMSKHANRDQFYLPEVAGTAGVAVDVLQKAMKAYPADVYNFTNQLDCLMRKNSLREFLGHVDKVRNLYNQGQYEIDLGIVQNLNNAVSYAGGDRWISSENVQEYLKKKAAKGVNMFKSKFPSLNELIYSYISQKLYIVSARPGDGKSTFMLNEGVDLAKRGNKVAFFTLEMSAAECFQRCCASVTKTEYVSLYDVGKPGVMEQYAKFAQAIKVGDGSLNFYEANSLQWDSLIQEIRAVVINHKIDVIFIDQLSHIRHDDNSYSKSHAIEKTVRALKDLANQLNIVVVLASQLNRDAVRSDKPSLIHLKDSGAVEEGADVVIMLERKGDTGLKIIVEKNRAGKTGRTEISWQFTYSTLVEEGEVVDMREIVVEPEPRVAPSVSQKIKYPSYSTGSRHSQNVRSWWDNDGDF